MIIPVWETVRESGDLPFASYHQTSPNFGKSREHDDWYRSPTHVSLTSSLPLIPTLSILHLINSQLFSPFPPQEISSPCHRKCPSTTQSLVPLLPYRYHWVASTRRHHQSHPVPDSPSRAFARKLGTKPIGLWMFYPEVTPPKNKAWHNKKLPNAFFQRVILQGNVGKTFHTKWGTWRCYPFQNLTLPKTI